MGLLSIAASACYALGNFRQARDYLERALAIQPDSKVLRDSFDKVMKKLG